MNRYSPLTSLPVLSDLGHLLNSNNLLRLAQVPWFQAKFPFCFDLHYIVWSVSRFRFLKLVQFWSKCKQTIQPQKFNKFVFGLIKVDLEFSFSIPGLFQTSKPGIQINLDLKSLILGVNLDLKNLIPGLNLNWAKKQ